MPLDRIQWGGKDRISNIEDQLAGVASVLYLPAANGSDDTTPLNAALASGAAVVRGRPGESYKISAPLVLKSNTTLDMTGCTVTLLSGSNCNLVHNNAWVVGSGRDTNIEVVGGTWDRGSNAGTGQQLHSILMQRVDQLVIRDLSVTSSAGKYAVCVYACAGFVVERLTFSVASDGVHLSGTCSDGCVRDIYGTTGDDSIALTPVDYSAYNNGDLGDMASIVIERIYTSESGGGNGVHLVAGNNASTPVYIRNITIRDVDVNPSAGSGVAIGGDDAHTETTNGYNENILLDNIRSRGTVNNTVTFAKMGTGAARGIVARRIVANSTQYTIAFTPGTVIEDITIRECYWNPPASTPAIFFSGSTPYPSVTTLRIVDCRLNVATKSGGLINTTSANATLTNLIVENLVASQCAWAIGDFFTNTSVIVRNLVAVNISGLANLRAAATLTLVSASAITGSHARHIANAGTIVGIIQSAGSGAPTFAGQVGDLYDRQDGGTGTYRYRCTVAGDDGAATWAGIL